MNVNIIYKFGAFKLTVSPLNLYKNDELLALTPKSLKLLILLIKNEGQFLSKSFLLKEIWQDLYVSESVLAVNINTLRKILGKDLIKNIKKQGYVFVGKATTIVDEETNLNIAKNNLDDFQISFDSFIGREKELRLLQLNFQSISAKKGMSVFINGEAGIGKTNLVRKFLEKVPHNANSIVLTTSFFDFIGSNNESVSLYFKLLFQAFLHLKWLENKDIDIEKKVAKIAQEKLGIYFSNDLIEQIFDNSVDNKINRLSVKFIDCFIALAKNFKLIIYFDDIQWADEFSLNLVGKLLNACKHNCLGIIISARIDEDTKKIKHFTQWIENQTRHNSFSNINLKPFLIEDCKNLFITTFDALSKIKSFSESDLNQIYQITGGNPYFIKELIYWLVADQKIIKLPANQNFSWQWQGMNSSELPPTLTSFALSRLESLSVEDRKILESACIVGEEFQIEMVAKVLEKKTSEIIDSFEIAVEKGILTKQILNRGNDYRFRHNLLYLTLYESILPNNLFFLHEKTAQILEEIYQNDSQFIANSLAQHYEASQNYQKCLYWSIESAKFASNTEDWAEIGKNIQRAELSIKKLGNFYEVSIAHKYYIAFYKAYFLLHTQRDNEFIQTLFEDSINFANQLNDKEKLAEALYNYAKSYRISGDVKKFINNLNEVLKVSEEANYQRIFWLAKKEEVIYEMLKGNYKMALKKAKELPTNIGNEYLESKFNAILGEICLFTGSYEEAKKQIIKTLNLFKKLGMSIEYNNTYTNDFVKYHIFIGEYQKAITIINNNDEYLRRNNLETNILYADLNRIQIKLVQGVFSEAKQISERILPEVIKDKTFYLQYFICKNLALIYLNESNFTESYKFILNFQSKISKVDDFDLNAENELLLAKYKNKLGKTDEALTHAKKALNFAIEAGSRLNEAFANIELAFSIKTYEPLESIKIGQRAIQILEDINSGEKWRAYWAVAQIQMSVSNKLIKTNEIIENLEKTVSLLDEIRNQFDLTNIENLERFAESTKTFSEPAKQMANIYQKLGNKEFCQKIAKEWNFEL